MKNAPENLGLCFETLGNELRVKILRELEKESLSVSQLAERLHSERSNVSHSLQMLKACSHVSVEKRGRESIYSINPNSTVVVFGNAAKNMVEGMKLHVERNCGSCRKEELIALHK